VAGLSPQQRHELAATINGALTGTDMGFVQMTVDVGGEVHLLGPELLASLGLVQNRLDNVIEPMDLPGAVVLNPPTPAAAPLLDRELAQLEAAETELSRSRARAEDLSLRLERARGSTSVEDVHQLKAHLDRARARMLELRAELRAAEVELGTEADLARERARLVERAQSLVRRRAELDELVRSAGDPGVPAEVEAALADVVRSAEEESADPTRSEARSLAEAIVRADAAVEKLAAHPQPPQWLLLQVKDELDEASARVRALEMQQADGIAVADQLARARTRFSDARSAWEELEQGPVGQLAEREGERAALLARARQLVGAGPDDDVRAAIATYASSSKVPEALVALRRALQAHDEGTDEVADAALVAHASRWCATRQEAGARVAAARAELAGIESDQRATDRHIAELDAGALDAPSRRRRIDGLRAELDDVVASEQELEERLARARRPAGERHATAEEVAELERALRNALADVDDIEREVADLRERVASAEDEAEGDDDSGDGERPWWEGGATPAMARAIPITAEVDVDVSSVQDDDVDRFVLAKAAGLRRAGRGESVPLVVDAAFDRLSPELALRMLDVFPKIGHIVQIVYLASTDLAEKWAKRQPESQVATVRLLRS